ASMLLAILFLSLTSVWWPLLIVMVLHAIVLRRFRDEMNTILSTREPGLSADFVADVLSHRALDLETLVELLTHLERARFTDRRLTVLQGRLASAGLPASRIIRRLHRLSEMLDSQRNTVVLPLG